MAFSEAHYVPQRHKEWNIFQIGTKWEKRKSLNEEAGTLQGVLVQSAVDKKFRKVNARGGEQ